MAFDVANAIAFLARNGIIHRDIKSLNVLLYSDGKAKLGDFGIAVLDNEPFKKLKKAGTPAYVAPEILEGKSADKKSDVYSYSIMLQELMTRKMPSKQISNDKTFYPKRDVTMRELPPLLDSSIKSLIEKARKSKVKERIDADQVVAKLAPVASRGMS